MEDNPKYAKKRGKGKRKKEKKTKKNNSTSLPVSYTP